MELRTLRSEDAEQAWQLDHETFHTAEDGRERYLRWFQPERMQGIFDGPRIVAQGGVWDFGQFFGRGRVPMGGISSMAVAPDQRGRGHARRILEALIESMHSRGQVISTLYPATTYLYRLLGWEMAGAHVIRKVSPQSLKDLPAPTSGRVRRGGDSDFGVIRACYEACAPEINGFLDLGDDWWGAWQDRSGREIYIAESDAGETTGYLVYRQLDGEYSSMGGPWGLEVYFLIAADRDAALGLWRILASWSSQVDQIYYRSAAEDPLLLLLPEQGIEVVGEVRWMTRVVDAVGAVAERGFPAGLEARVDVELRDPLVASNDGCFTLTVSKGRGHLELGGAGGVAMDIGAFSSLFTGWATTSLLARSGLLEGGSAEERASLDAVFAGPTPWIPHEF